MSIGKRELLARGLTRGGALAVLRHLPQRDRLLVLNYHRIGDPALDAFDPALFSATTDELNDQVSYLKKRFSLITMDEALAFVAGKVRTRKNHLKVLITFDDGYLDNYEMAFPILRSQGVQGIFFLVTGMVGSCTIPWWDRIAYLMRTASRPRFLLRYPTQLAVDIQAAGITASLREVLSLYKRPDNKDPLRFIEQVREATDGENPPDKDRRFLDWQEAREMARGGMVIGSHTHSHSVLSQLEPELQRHELTHSRALLREQLGVEAEALAYPVGNTNSFSDQTQQLALETGYRIGFSFRGGLNVPGQTSIFDVTRVNVGDQSWPRFQVQAAMSGVTGCFWP